MSAFSWIVVIFSPFVLFVLTRTWQFIRQDRDDWCDCHQYNLIGRTYKKSKNGMVHRRNLCCPSIETVW